MRPVEFQPHEIIEAGEALVSAGRNVTGFALRQKVGGGNPARLKQVWDEHLAGRNTKDVTPVAELPIEVAEEIALVTKALTDRISQLAIELNDKAVKAAERRASEIVRAAAEQREQAERELTDAAETVEELESLQDAAENRIKELETLVTQFQEKNQAQQVEIAKLQERLAASEQSLVTVKATHEQKLEKANNETTLAKSELENYRQRTAEKIELLRDELAQYRERLSVSDKLADSLKTELQEAQRRDSLKIEDFRQQLAEVKSKLAAETQAHLSSKEQAQRDQSRQLADLEKSIAQRDAALAEAAKAREALANLSGHLEAVKKQNSELMNSTLKGQGRADVKKASKKPFTAEESPDPGSTNT